MMDDGECSRSKLDSTNVRREMDDLRVRWISHERFLSSHEVAGKLSVHERRCRWEILSLGRFILTYSKESAGALCWPNSSNLITGIVLRGIFIFIFRLVTGIQLCQWFCFFTSSCRMYFCRL